MKIKSVGEKATENTLTERGVDMAVKNLIFDVGNVLFEYRWYQMLLDFGLTDEEAQTARPLIFDNKLWNEFDLGNLTTQEIIDRYCKELPQYEALLRWFFGHLELMHVARRDVWDRVHALKEKGYRIYLLSNYSEDFFNAHTKDASFMKDLDGRLVSYEVHMMKPDPAIYKCLLEKYDLNPEESVFFDDRPENTETAEKLGIKSYTITSKEYLISVLDEYLNRK